MTTSSVFAQNRRAALRLTALRLAAVLLAALAVPASAAGNCSEADLGAWKASLFAESEQKLEICGKSSLGENSELELCVGEQFAELSALCRDCFEDVVRCTALRCAGTCFGSLFFEPTEVCRECVVTKCNPPFATCAGFPIDTCTDCVVPDETDGLPLAAIIGISVAGGAVLLACIALLLFKCQQRPLSDEERQERLERQVAKLGVQGISYASSTITGGSASQTTRSRWNSTDTPPQVPPPPPPPPGSWDGRRDVPDLEEPDF